MSNVDSNIETLMLCCKNIQITISCIKSTRMSLIKKYKNLDAVWNDKQYRILNNIIRECDNALSEIINVLSYGENVIRSLATSLVEYENVNLEFNHKLESVNGALNNDVSCQFCLGVYTKGTIPDGYISIIEERYNNARPNVRNVFDLFAVQLQIQDSTYPSTQTAHYSPTHSIGHQRGVYYNATLDMNNPRGAGTTYFHELAHMIDHASTGYDGNLSQSPEFREALIEDGQRVLRLYNNLPAEQQASFLARIRADSAHSFSDLIDATTNGQLHGSYGHTREYWSHPGNLQAEAFSHFFEASMGDEEKLSLLANFFPRSFLIFSNLIDSILADQHI